MSGTILQKPHVQKNSGSGVTDRIIPKIGENPTFLVLHRKCSIFFPDFLTLFHMGGGTFSSPPPPPIWGITPEPVGL